MRKIRVGLYLLNRQFVRSWFDSGLVSKLSESQKIEFVVFASSEIFSSVPRSENYVVINIGNVSKSKWTSRVTLASLVEKRDKSLTLKFRFRRFFVPETWLLCRSGSRIRRAKWFLKSVRRTIGNSKENFHVVFYTFPFVRSYIRRQFSKADPTSAIPNEILGFNLDWAIIPTASSSSFVTDLIKYFNHVDIPTLVAIDNWDNISSKSVFPIHPTFLTVMGRKDIEHASRIHGLPETVILPIGLPRFDAYRQFVARGPARSQRQVKQILYCGFSLAHSEMRVIDELASALEEFFGIGTVEVTYRPHPGALPRFDAYQIRNPRILTYQFSDLSRTELPVTDEKFIEELSRFDIVVGAPTTLMFEAMMLRMPCIIDLTEDDFHRTTAGNASKNYTHIQDLLSIPGLESAKTISELCDRTIEMLKSGVSEVHYDIASLFDLRAPLFSDSLLDILVSKTKALSNKKCEVVS